MKKLKILFDYTPLCRESKTGIPVFVKNLYEALEKHDTLQMEKTFSFCKYISTKHWKVYRFFEQVLYHNLYLPFKLYFGKYDVYVENQYMFIPLFKPKNTLVVTVLYDIALALYDDLQTKEHTDKWRKNLPKSIHNSDILLTISKSSKVDIEKYLVSMHQDKTVEYIYIDTDEVQQTAHDKQSVMHKYGIRSHYFLFLGTLEPRKNPLNLVKAFHLFKQQTNSDIQLVYAGKKGWLYHDVLTYIKEHKLENDVIFTGFVSDEEKEILLQYTDAFLFLSLYEGFGIPILEALRRDVPCLVSDIAVFHELFSENVCYTNHEKPEEIALSMQKILNTPPKIDIHSLEKFSWEASANQFVDILRHR